MAIFSCATWRPISCNIGGTIYDHHGALIHHAVGDGSNWALFNDPNREISAHFWIAKSGLIEQYVDTSRVAWHAMQLNDRYIGVETEGCGAPPHAEPLTEAQIDAFGRLYAEGHRMHGWPYVLIDHEGQRGFGYHRMAVQTACPCDVRKNARSEILARAQGLPPGSTPPSGGDDDMQEADFDRIEQIVDYIVVKHLGAGAVTNPGAALNAGVAVRTDANRQRDLRNQTAEIVEALGGTYTAAVDDEVDDEDAATP
jgi:hypothetical protein